MSDDADAPGWELVGRSNFGRRFLAGCSRVEAIAFQNEESGEVRLIVEVSDAQIFALPNDLVPLVQIIGWAIASLAADKLVMVPSKLHEDPLGKFRVWQGCCEILNSVDPWVRHAKPDV